MTIEKYSNPVQPVEIERKFLVSSLPEHLDRYDNSMIRQGYVVIGEDGSEVRIRSKSTLCYITVKKPASSENDGLKRLEIDEQIPRQLFDELWKSTEGMRVEKVRFVIPYNNYVIELDIYLGELSGLVTAEVEFDDENTAMEFTPPDWLGEDVTSIKAYKNQNLARFGKPE
jgi:CYTH domain-containing protein